MSTQSDRSKFLSKHIEQREIYQLENTEYEYFYPDQQNITALLSSEKLLDEESLEAATLINRFNARKEINCKKLRKFILGSQKFKPDYIEFITEGDALKLKSVSVEEGFESEISFDISPSESIRYRLEFEHIKALKYLRKGTLTVQLTGEGPIKFHFNEYNLGFLLLGS